MSRPDKRLPYGDILVQSTDRLDVVRLYCNLVVRRTLSDSEVGCLSQILELAESDGVLDFWINEADHFIAHELNLTDEESIHACENQQARLREGLEHSSVSSTEIDLDLSKELTQRLQVASKELQQHLKNRGFDPGPLDGVLGPRTQAALINFQEAHQLTADGIADAATRDALGLG